MAEPNLSVLFLAMARMRAFEEAIAGLWWRGLIGGELHLGTGEEAIVAGVVGHLAEGDGLTLDYRSTPPLVARGADLRALVLELLGHEQGLCGGRGGHMHLMDPERLAAASGIVGATGPLGCGFAVAAQHLRPAGVAVAFFGEGAANQGMLMESLNLAGVWRLPLVFVCKDNRFAITTHSPTVTAGDLLGRARSFGLAVARVDGTDVEAVWEAAGRAVGRARRGQGPSFLLARCQHLDGHLLGDQLVRTAQRPIEETRAIAPALLEALRRGPGAPWRSRLAGLASMGATLARVAVGQPLVRRDPLEGARRRLPTPVATRLQQQAEREVQQAVAEAVSTYAGGA